MVSVFCLVVQTKFCVDDDVEVEDDDVDVVVQAFFYKGCQSHTQVIVVVAMIAVKSLLEVGRKRDSRCHQQTYS